MVERNTSAKPPRDRRQGKGWVVVVGAVLMEEEVAAAVALVVPIAYRAAHARVAREAVARSAVQPPREASRPSSGATQPVRQLSTRQAELS